MLVSPGRAVDTVEWVVQTVDPSVVIDAPGPARGIVSFVLTILFGGFVLYRYGSRVDDALAASTAKPLMSIIYGFAGFGLTLFMSGFLLTQLITVAGARTLVVAGGLAIGGAVVCTLGGAGFVVVGVWLARTLGAQDPWIGLVAVGAGTALAWAVLPWMAAAVVWIATAAAGIGGPTRLWIHQDSESIYDV